MYVGLDFETYSATDLKVHGLDRYLNDPFFKVLRAGIVEEYSPLSQKRLDFDMTNSSRMDDFVAHLDDYRLNHYTLVPFNQGFERGVLRNLGIDPSQFAWEDAATASRVSGVSGKLEAAGPQLLDRDKDSKGEALIKLFCVPSKEQLETGYLAWDETLPVCFPGEWTDLGTYCMQDADLGLSLRREASSFVRSLEDRFDQATTEMNEVGWPVDVEMVAEMQRRYLENVAQAEADFRLRTGARDLNLNSLKQMKEWCAARGIKATSFNEASVQKMIDKIEPAISGLSLRKAVAYSEVLDLLRTKQVLGGSSLTKLQKILDLVGNDNRLRHQYLHAGAAQTLRTTGKGVQMQNLKRLPDPDNPEDMDALFDDSIMWDNDKLAENLRQCFVSSHQNGELLVGDFKSVESRGLAWLARASWKLTEFFMGRDMYKVLAEKIYHVHYDDVLKSQRQVGKVGELACGYGAAGEAVREFAKNMGTIFTEFEASQLVADWRRVNPEILAFWDALMTMMLRTEAGASSGTLELSDGYHLTMHLIDAPSSLSKQAGREMKTLMVTLLKPQGGVYMSRLFHGIHRRGRNLSYFKPSERKTGDLWRNWYINPKTKQRQFYELYGGKMAGILTQSLCREIFMRRMVEVSVLCENSVNLTLIGQFHDELVVDWTPKGPGRFDGWSLDGAINVFTERMSIHDDMLSFPLEADIKHAYRYNK